MGCNYSKYNKDFYTFINEHCSTEEMVITTEISSEITTNDYNYLSKLEMNNENLLKWQWVIAPNKYEDLYFIDKDKIAVKNKFEKWGIIDKNGNTIVNFIYDEIREFSEGYAPVRINNKWGFINSTGQACITVKYAEVGSFSEGKAAVKKDKNSDLWAYVDHNDKIIIDYKPYTAVGGLHSFAGEFKNSKAFASKDILVQQPPNQAKCLFMLMICFVTIS